MKEREGTQYVAVFHRLLFSLNFGFASALTLRAYLSRFARHQNTFSDSAIRAVAWIDKLFHFDAGSPVGVELTFLMSIGVLALIVLVLLRILAGSNARDAILRTLAGITALIAVPLCLLSTNTVRWSLTAEGYTPVFALELGIVAVCFGLYYCGKWAIPAWCTATLLTVHYSLWAWFMWSLFSPPLFALILSGLPACAGLAWALYVRHPNHAPARSVARDIGAGD
jgi:hypothetical protein